MTAEDISSFEARARRLAFGDEGRAPVPHQKLLEFVDTLERQGAAAAHVFRRAVEMQEEVRQFESSMALAEVMAAAVYRLRPNGPLPSDGVGL